MAHVLPVVRHRGTGPHLHVAGERRHLAEQRLDERTLAGAVGAHEGDHFVALEHYVHVAYERARSVRRGHTHRDVIRFDHAITAAIAGVEPQRHHAVAANGRREARHACQQLAPPLGLTRVLSGEVARDVVHLRRDLRLLLVELPLLREPALLALLHEAFVPASVREGGAALEVQHVIGHRVEERAIVADAQHRLVGVGEIPLEPGRRVEIEVVGGLVEDVQIGRRGELPRERHAPAFTAAQRADARAACHVGRKAHAHQNRVHLRRHLVAALALEPFEVAAVLLHRRFAVIGLELRRLLRQRGFELAQLAERIGHDVPQALIVGEAPVLIHERHAQPRRARHRPARGLQVAGDEPHERGLARAIAPHDGPAIARGNSEGDVAEDFGGAEVDTGVAEGEKRHPYRVIGTDGTAQLPARD